MTSGREDWPGHCIYQVGNGQIQHLTTTYYYCKTTYDHPPEVRMLGWFPMNVLGADTPDVSEIAVETEPGEVL